MIKWAIYALVAIACVATATLAWEHFVIAPAEARGQARQAALKQAQEYAAAQQAAQAKAEEAQHENQTRIDALDAQVAKLSDDKRIVLSAYARLVLDAASRTANAGQAPAAAASAATGAAAVPAVAGISERDLGAYASQAAATYADAVS